MPSNDDRLYNIKSLIEIKGSDQINATAINFENFEEKKKGFSDALTLNFRKKRNKALFFYNSHLIPT